MPAKRGFPFALVRTMLLAGVSVGACIWALTRAYRPRPPMVVPATSSSEIAPSSDASLEIPVPDLERSAR